MWTPLGQQADRWWPGMQSPEVWTSRLTHSMARSGAGCRLGAQQWFSTCIPAHGFFMFLGLLSWWMGFENVP